MARFRQISDANQGQAIGSITSFVPTYPADDKARDKYRRHDISVQSRNIVENFIDTLNDSLVDRMYAALARVMSAPTGGQTQQNINMLSKLRDNHLTGKSMKNDRLFSDAMAGMVAT